MREKSPTSATEGVISTLIEGYVPTDSVESVAKEIALLDDAIPDEVLSGAEEALKERFSDLITTCREENCDLIGVKDLLYKYNTKYFEAVESVAKEIAAAIERDVTGNGANRAAEILKENGIEEKRRSARPYGEVHRQSAD